MQEEVRQFVKNLTSTARCFGGFSFQSTSITVWSPLLYPSICDTYTNSDSIIATVTIIMSSSASYESHDKQFC